MMVRKMIWLALLLGSIPGAICHCRSGLEPLGEFLKDVDHQMSRVLSVTSHVCKDCKDCAEGCFRDLIEDLKRDIYELKEAKHKLTDVFLGSECVYPDVCVIVGPEDGAATIFHSSGETTTLPFSNAWGIDYDATTDLMVYNTFLEIFETDFSGNSPTLIDAKLPPTFLGRPEIHGDTVFYSTFVGDIYRYTGGTIVQIVKKEDNVDGIFSITVDPLAGHVYWLSSMANHDTLKRSTLAGENIETAKTDPRGFKTVDIEPTTRMLYYTTIDPAMLVQYDLHTGASKDITALQELPIDMSVCVNKIYLSYNGDSSKYDVVDLQGNISPGKNIPGNNDFVAIATTNHQK